jgi:hypothetical protein
MSDLGDGKEFPVDGRESGMSNMKSVTNEDGRDWLMPCAPEAAPRVWKSFGRPEADPGAFQFGKLVWVEGAEPG